MISINKQGNAIVIEFTDNDKYLFNGKIEVAPNELIVVVDQSDMVTFKRASNGDVLFSQLVDDIQIAGSPVTKDTVIDQFALIGFTSGGGGISDAPSDNKLYGRKNGNWSEVPSTDNFATKQEISDMLTKSEAASTYQPKGEYLTSIPEEYVTDSELSAKGYATTSQLSSKLDVSTYNSEKANFATKDELNSKADTSAIADMATQTWVQGQGYLTEVPSNYVTDSELTEALADKQDKGDYALKSDLTNLATKEELATKADTSALSAKQDTLVSGTNIKTINGETILGAGDLTISSQSRTWMFTCSSSITPSDFATITPDGFTSQEWLSQVAIGDMVYLHKGQEFMKLSVSNIYLPTTGNTKVGLSFYSDRLYWVLVIGSSFSLMAHTVPIGETNSATSLGQEAAVTAGSYGVAIGNNAKSNGYNAIVIGNYIQEDEQLSINIGDYLKVSYANGFSYWDGTQMQSLKDQLATLTPPTVDTAMSDTSENAVQNKVIKKYIDDLVGNILTQLQEINGTN